MSYEWDPHKADSNFDKHGVHFADAAGVFEDEYTLWQEDVRHHEENRYVVIGLDFLAQIVTVVFTFRGDTIRIISARPATNNERNTYERKRK